MSTLTIVGGGVAGLALAATIDPAAFDVTLIERHPGYSRVPTAFGIWPFALEALERIKLADELRDRGLLLTSGAVTADSAHRPVTMTQQDPDTWLITRPALLQLLDDAVPDTVAREQRHQAAAEQERGAGQGAGAIDRMPGATQVGGQPAGDALVVFHHQHTHAPIVPLRLT